MTLGNPAGARAPRGRGKIIGAQQHSSIERLRAVCLHTAGKVFRTAAPLKATEGDVSRLYNDLGIKDLVGIDTTHAVQ